MPVPGDWQTLSRRPLLDALKPALEKADVHGEVGFVRHMAREQKLIIPVTIPGRETTMSISTASLEATIVTRETGLADAVVTLHKSPGLNHPSWRFAESWNNRKETNYEREITPPGLR